ncbi:hypothetical protein SLEP1_g27146 [Rubroshorea leprosula]|uniref:Uncharacterized protein n=1 Tax=Rubroshorea leprosula TaxID=152421 RepID=A0AAV5JVJ1_9ROSI|nr:hypothetical protein SLEP1_g27146 [Rubroshorea leprosula]
MRPDLSIKGGGAIHATPTRRSFPGAPSFDCRSDKLLFRSLLQPKGVRYGLFFCNFKAQNHISEVRNM